MRGRVISCKHGVGFLVCGLVLSCSAPREDHKPGEDASTNRNAQREAPTVVFSVEAQRAAGLRVEPVGAQAFRPRLRAAGVIRADAQKTVVVRARTAGRVVRVLVDVGAAVPAGHALATLEGPDVTGALARYRTATAREAVARRAAERADRLLEAAAISRADRDWRAAEAEAAASEAEAARQDLVRLGLDGKATSDTGRPSEFEITAPLPGRVLERSVSPGLLLEKDAPAFVIAALDEVWAVVDVYEKDLGRIQEKGEVEVRSDAYPDEVFRGRLALLEPGVDEGTRTARARVILANPAGKLRPGLTVTAELPLRGASGGENLAVPVDALQKIAGLPAVFVEQEPGRYELRSIEVGPESGGFVEVTRGLDRGEKVVVAGAFVLKSELLKKSLAGEQDW